jgi:hypothetical protein
VRKTPRLALAIALSGALVLGTGGAALAQEVPAFNPDAVSESDGGACLGQLVAYAVRPHPGYTGHGLAGDAPGHGYDSVAGLMQELLMPACE